MLTFGLIFSMLAFSPHAALSASSDAETTIVPKGGLDGRGLAFGQEKHYEKYETLAARQDVPSTTSSQVTSGTTSSQVTSGTSSSQVTSGTSSSQVTSGTSSSQDTSSTTSSLSTIATSAVIFNDLGEGSTFFIPTKSNNPWQQNITDLVSMYDKSIMAFSVHYNADFVSLGNANISDIEPKAPTLNFTACVQRCVQYDELYQNPPTPRVGCEGVSWVNNYCYLKSGLGLTENVTFTTRIDAISALKHFLIPSK